MPRQLLLPIAKHVPTFVKNVLLLNMELCQMNTLRCRGDMNTLCTFSKRKTNTLLRFEMIICRRIASSAWSVSCKSKLLLSRECSLNSSPFCQRLVQFRRMCVSTL
ncbi:hypothetical protein Dimus_019986 [Dionaea muscipula]